MTLREAIAAGIRRVRKPYWAHTESLELPQKDDRGRYGPWCQLHGMGFVADQPALTVIPVLLMAADDGEADWEPLPESG